MNTFENAYMRPRWFLLLPLGVFRAATDPTPSNASPATVQVAGNITVTGSDLVGTGYLAEYE